MRIMDCLTFIGESSTFLNIPKRGSLTRIKASPLEFKPHSDGTYAAPPEFSSLTDC